MVSPGISPSNKIIRNAVKQGIPILTDLDIFCAFNNSKKIIVTGTNGKTTVTTLINKVLIASGANSIMGGNVFPPILDLVNVEADVFVIEASSFQLYYSNNMHADISVILNITEDHLDWHSSIEQYQKAKLKLSYCSDNMVINSDDNNINISNHNSSKVLRYGIEDQEKTDFTFDKTKELSTINYKKEEYLTINNPYLDFYHNKSNLLAITAICHLLNVNKTILKIEFEKFKGLPHRMQTVPTNDAIQWINDSKSTNSSSLYASIKSFKRNIILIMGGDDKGSEFDQLVANLEESSVTNIILIGKSKQKFLSFLENKISCEIADDLKSAVYIAKDLAEENEVVLFSPGCSSKDMFSDYIDRGNTFIQPVNDCTSNI